MAKHENFSEYFVLGCGWKKLKNIKEARGKENIVYCSHFHQYCIYLVKAQGKLDTHSQPENHHHQRFSRKIFQKLSRLCQSHNFDGYVAQ